MSQSRRLTRKAPMVICALCTALVAAQYFAEAVIDRVPKTFRIPVVNFLREFKPLQSAEYYVEDALASSFGRRAKVHPELVYLAIDRDSVQLDQFAPEEIEASPALQMMKQGWPWSRAVYPLIIERLINSGAKVVVMDLLFPTQRDGDEAFRDMLAKYRDRVVIGANVVQGQRGSDAGGIKMSTTLQFPSSDLIPPDELLPDRIGFVNFWPDGDGVIRHVEYGAKLSEIFGDPPEHGEPVYRSLAAAGLEKSGNGKSVSLSGARRIRFAGPAGTFIPRSVCDLFDPKKWNSPDEYDGGKFFRNKIVMIGPEGNFLKDTVRTPFGTMPGPELHLNAMNAALDQDYLSEWPGCINYVLIALGGAVAWALCAGVSSPLARFASLGFACFLWLMTVKILFDPGGILALTFNPLVALLSCGVCSSSWDFFVEQREKALLRRSLERYLPKDAVKEMVENRESILHTLGGVRKPVAFLFTDLRGFTSMTEEATDSHALLAQLNEYLGSMVELIQRECGAFDKFIGDAIMAAWGNLQSRGPVNDVRNAVVATLKMREKLKELNGSWTAQGRKPFAMGMGINFGDAIVGNVGSLQQMNLTAIGDTVNLASRIEGVTKEYGVDLLVGEDGAKLVRHLFYMQSAGLVQVKGRKKPVELFYVISERGATPDLKLEEYLLAYSEGIALYLHGDFVAAGERFRHALSLRPEDSLSPVYIERCSVLAVRPLPPDWNGVYVMTKK